MNDRGFDFLAHPYGVQFHGPFQAAYRVTVQDYRVPHLAAFAGDGRWLLVCDERFMLDVSDEEARRLLPFLAHCMAVAAGYSSHGEHAEPVNPYRHRLRGITPERDAGAGKE